MRYEWDERKRVANLARHNVDFATAVDFNWETALEILDDRHIYGEERWLALGFVAKRSHVMVYTLRANTIRIISLRRANKREKEFYESKT